MSIPRSVSSRFASAYMSPSASSTDFRSRPRKRLATASRLSQRARSCHNRHAPGLHPGRRAVERSAVEHDVARVRAERPGQAGDERRLAGAVPAHQGHQLARREVDVDASSTTLDPNRRVSPGPGEATGSAPSSTIPGPARHQCDPARTSPLSRQRRSDLPAPTASRPTAMPTAAPRAPASAGPGSCGGGWPAHRGGRRVGAGRGQEPPGGGGARRSALVSSSPPMSAPR